MDFNNIAKNSSLVILLSVLAMIIGYLLRLFVARNLSVSDYGLLYAVLAFVGFFSTFRDQELGTALAKFIPEFLAKGQTGRIKASIIIVAAVQLTLGLLIVIPIFLFADRIAIHYFRTANAALPLQLISLSFLASAIMSVLQRTFQGLGKMFYFALVEPMRLTLVFSVSFFLIAGLGVSGVSYGYLLASIVVPAFLFVAMMWVFPLFKTKTALDIVLVRRLLFFSLPLFIAGIGSMIMNYVDTLALIMFTSLYDVGLYQAALPTSQLLWFFIGGFGAVLLPTVSRLWVDGKKEAISDGVLILSKVLLLMLVPVIILLAAFPEIILRILYGEPYVAAAQSLQILSVGALFYSFYIMFNTILVAIGKPVLYTKMWIVVGVVSIALNFLLIPLFGINGAAIANVISYIVGLVIASYFTGKFIPLRFPLLGTAKTLVGGIGVFFLVSALKSFMDFDPTIEIFVSGVISIIAYTIFAIRFIINKNDLKILSTMGIKMPGYVNNLLMKAVRN